MHDARCTPASTATHPGVRSVNTSESEARQAIARVLPSLGAGTAGDVRSLPDMGVRSHRGRASRRAHQGPSLRASIHASCYLGTCCLGGLVRRAARCAILVEEPVVAVRSPSAGAMYQPGCAACWCWCSSILRPQGPETQEARGKRQEARCKLQDGTCQSPRSQDGWAVRYDDIPTVRSAHIRPSSDSRGSR